MASQINFSATPDYLVAISPVTTAMAPSITDPYSIFTLPRISDIEVLKKVIVPAIKSADTSIIDLGVSKSIISSYLLKPTPKLVWSYSLSPSTIIDCMDVLGDETSKQYIIGLTERRKYKLLLINRDAENKITTDEVKISTRITGVKFEDQYVYVLTESGIIEVYQIEDSKLIKQFQYGEKCDQVIYHKFVDEHQYKFNNKLLVLVKKVGKNSHIEVLSVSPSKIFSVINHEYHEDLSGNKFVYNQGVLYQLNIKTRQITAFKIEDFKIINTISIKSLLAEETELDDVSIHCPSVDRLLIGVKQTMYLVNFKYSSLLDKFENSGDLFINQVVRVGGSTSKNSDTFAIFLNFNNQEKNIDLNIINLNVGVNKLSECLGKSINKQEEEFKGTPSIMNEAIEKENDSNRKKLVDSFKKLKAFRDDLNIKKFNALILSTMKPKGQNEFVFDVNKDSIIDLNFLSQVLSLIFVNDGELKFYNDEFIPEESLIYLLTHPGFSYKYTKGLLQLFNQTHQARLLRQAILTCSNIPIDELVNQFIEFSKVEKMEKYEFEILNDLINRLVNEYSMTEITQTFKKFEIDNLNQILVNLIKFDTLLSLQLLLVVIDIGGLFNWSTNLLVPLQELVESKINALIANSYNLTLTNQALNNDQLDSILTLSEKSGGIELSQKTPQYSIDKLGI